MTQQYIRPNINGKKVCELGAGQSGLVGFLIAALFDPTEVAITDGNTLCANSKGLADQTFRAEGTPGEEQGEL
jgi:hypothetical protein